jgi:hypothetical protein
MVVLLVDTKEQEVDSSGSCGRKRYCYPCIQNW